MLHRGWWEEDQCITEIGTRHGIGGREGGVHVAPPAGKSGKAGHGAGWKEGLVGGVGRPLGVEGKPRWPGKPGMTRGLRGSVGTPGSGIQSPGEPQCLGMCWWAQHKQTWGHSVLSGRGGVGGPPAAAAQSFDPGLLSLGP